jgi:hypothetical protein
MDEFEKAARENLDRHIGDVCSGDDDIEVIREEAWTLAHDGAVDAGATMEQACEIAYRIVEVLY